MVVKALKYIFCMVAGCTWLLVLGVLLLLAECGPGIAATAGGSPVAGHMEGSSPSQLASAFGSGTSTYTSAMVQLPVSKTHTFSPGAAYADSAASTGAAPQRGGPGSLNGW